MYCSIQYSHGKNEGDPSLETCPHEKSLRLPSLEQPSVRKSELLVDIEVCGVRRSNLHIINPHIIGGNWKSYGGPSMLPMIPGHKIVGIVRKLGDSVRRIKVGEMVGNQRLCSSCLR